MLKYKAVYDTEYDILNAYRGLTIDANVNVMRIIPSASEEFSAVLHANPDVPFSIDATTKFTTNMESSSFAPTHGKAKLTYTMTCTPPTSATDATDPTKAATCCESLFTFTSPILTKNK
jgi:hypothetical protein